MPNWASWDLTAKGLYYVSDRNTIERLNFSTGKTATMASIGDALDSRWLCVSRDDAFIVWSQYERPSADLMLVEGFR